MTIEYDKTLKCWVVWEKQGSWMEQCYSDKHKNKCKEFVNEIQKNKKTNQQVSKQVKKARS